MTSTDRFDKDRRRKRILIRNTVFVLVAYAITQLASLAAKVLDLSSITYTQIAIMCAIVLGATIVYIVIIFFKKNITTSYANVIFFSQFGVWMIMYTLWIYYLQEIRIAGLFFAVMALVFLLSNSNFIQSLSITLAAVTIQTAVAYVAINHYGQKGSFVQELFFISCFFPSAVMISFLAQQFNRQRSDIKTAKRQAERARDSLWGEMELAKKIQTVLLPDRPAIAGYEIAAHMAPAEEVGGDYYDILNIDGKDWIAIGDVSGHGVPAGLLMMMTQTSIKVALAQHPDMHPSELLTVINGVITENIHRLHEDKYMTITVLAAFDNGRFFFSGLHQDIMVYRQAARQVDVVETRGMWLGVMDNIRDMVQDDMVHLQVGDVMLVYTDGITEATLRAGAPAGNDAVGDLFGSDRLRDVFLSLGDRPTPDIKTGIIAALDGYQCDDDVTLLILRRKA